MDSVYIVNVGRKIHRFDSNFDVNLFSDKIIVTNVRKYVICE